MVEFGLVYKKYSIIILRLSLNSIKWVNFGALYFPIHKEFVLDQHIKFKELC
jgi:hypothetical protein